jgi:hypothetical protein
MKMRVKTVGYYTFLVADDFEYSSEHGVVVKVRNTPAMEWFMALFDTGKYPYLVREADETDENDR